MRSARRWSERRNGAPKRIGTSHRWTKSTLVAGGKAYRYVSLPAVAESLGFALDRLPFSLRIVLESLARRAGSDADNEALRQLADWQPRAERIAEVPFFVSRVLLQDFAGIPLLLDLAAMRDAAHALGKDPALIEPVVPVDLVVDHSVKVDQHGTAGALAGNLSLEFKRNRERYEFLKWAQRSFRSIRIVPPGNGIVHQVNMEFLASGVAVSDDEVFFDTLVGTDSHTPMVNGIGILGWGVGGIEAASAMLGQPMSFLTPDVVGVHLCGALREGATSTDLALSLTQVLRKEKLAGTFVEFFGAGVAAIPVAARATIANMAPEYGATTGYFPVDEATLRYYRATGRSEEQVALIGDYFRAQHVFGVLRPGDIAYSRTVEFDLGGVRPSVAGPRRPQDRVNLEELGRNFRQSFPAARKDPSRPIGHGDVLLAAITSCTNTSSPEAMITAGLVAKAAVEAGLRVAPHVKTSLTPGSRAVTEYLRTLGLLRYLEALGFHVAGYGCATCMGYSGPLLPGQEEELRERNLVCAAVLSGNRNFDARVHPALRANYLASPGLVVCLAIAGTVDIDPSQAPLGVAAQGPVYLRDLWPSAATVAELASRAQNAALYRHAYSPAALNNSHWDALPLASSTRYAWPASSFLVKPPFFDDFSLDPPGFCNLDGARILAIFGDSLTTDHISPVGGIETDSDAGRYLRELGVAPEDFNSYGARRGNHEVMVRGAFSNPRVRNLMLPSDLEGGLTRLQPSGELLSIYQAAQGYAAQGVPLAIIAGEEYGTGSSRDWAAKATRLLGVRMVVARSFERIHRSNLVGMGVLPLQFREGDSAQTLGLLGDESLSLTGGEELQPRKTVSLVIARKDGSRLVCPVQCRADTPYEVEQVRHGGIMPLMLRKLQQRG